MMSSSIEIIIILVLIFINGLLALSELAVVSAREVRLRQRAEEGSEGAQAALVLQSDPNRFLSTVQVGITLVAILTGAFGGARLSGPVAGWLERVSILEPYADGLAFVLVVAVITYLSLVIGELVPKRLALQHAEALAVLVARPMQVLSRITSPVVSVLAASTDIVLRVIRVRPADEPEITEEEVRALIHQGTEIGIFETAEQEMVVEVFRLADRSVKEIMTPRTRITWIDADDPLEKMREIVANTDFRSYPVVRGGLDVIVGVVRSRDFWHIVVAEGEPLESVIHEALFVPESLPVFNLLSDFRSRGEELAIVLDEYGGVDGIVSLQDIVDEIAGEFARPDEERPIVQRSDGSWLVDGMLAIHDFSDAIGLPPEVDGISRDYDTVAGFVIDELGRIPEVGDAVQLDRWRFEIVDMDRNRVDKILVSHDEPSPDDESQPERARS